MLILAASTPGDVHRSQLVPTVMADLEEMIVDPFGKVDEVYAGYGATKGGQWFEKSRIEEEVDKSMVMEETQVDDGRDEAVPRVAKRRTHQPR